MFFRSARAVDQKFGVKKPSVFTEGFVIMWRRPTLPGVTPVPSALQGLTSLFGMGRGGTPALGRLICKYTVGSKQYSVHSSAVSNIFVLRFSVFRLPAFSTHISRNCNKP